MGERRCLERGSRMRYPAGVGELDWRRVPAPAACPVGSRAAGWV